MDRKVIITSDGSHSISIPEMNVTYHSSHGAIQESAHVFIETGLRYLLQSNPSLQAINIFEMGFGTGLNALLTLIEAEKIKLPVFYQSIELYPLEPAMYQSLNYCEQLQRQDIKPIFTLLHESDWNKEIDVSTNFSFLKTQTDLASFTNHNKFDLVYFDAFAPEDQPQLWTEAIFKKLFDMLNTGGILTTYCSKSIVRKSMTAAGFTVSKQPGPPHKREIVRAVR